MVLIDLKLVNSTRLRTFNCTFLDDETRNACSSYQLNVSPCPMSTCRHSPLNFALHDKPTDQYDHNITPHLEGLSTF